MKFNKLFAAIMMVATVGFFACQPKNTPVGPGVVDPDDTTKTTPSEPVVVEDGDTMTVAQAIAYVQSLGKDVLSDKSVFVKGVISSISNVNLSYGNATFDIKDADADNKFTCFQVNYLGNSPFRSEDAIAVGDVVVVFGKVVNYKGNTPETEGKGAAYVFSQNGNTEAPAFTDPEAQVVTIAQAKEIIDGLADGATTPDWYQISCEVAKLPTTADQLAQYNNVNYTIKDETGSMTAYKVYNVGNTNFHDMSEVPPVGSKLVLVGKLTLYTNKNTGAKTYEMTPCYIKEVVELGTGESQGGEQGGDATDGGVKTIAEALAIIDGLADGASTTEAYTITGEVKSVITSDANIQKYHNVDFWMKDSEGNEIEAFRTTEANGGAVTAAPEVGSTVTVHGVLTKYVKDGKVTPEINKGYFVR